VDHNWTIKPPRDRSCLDVDACSTSVPGQCRPKQVDGLTIADVQQAVESGIGGMNVAENVEGRSRYPINVRYQRDFRDNVGELSRVLIATPSGAQIPISEVAKTSFSRGPAMIRDEDGQLMGYVYIDLNTTGDGGFVGQASKMLRQKMQLPAGYTYQWSGDTNSSFGQRNA